VPVIVADGGVPRAELAGRARAPARDQALRTANAYVVRQTIDERWPVHEAIAVGVLASDAEVDTALARGTDGAPLEKITTRYGHDIERIARTRAERANCASGCHERVPLQVGGTGGSHSHWVVTKPGVRTTNAICGGFPQSG
jgi:hypothetical protein